MPQGVVGRAVARLVAGVATVAVILLLFNAFASRVARPVAVGVAIGLAIAVSAVVDSKLSRTPLSARFVLLRAAVSGLVAALVLSYLQR